MPEVWIIEKERKKKKGKESFLIIILNTKLVSSK